MRAHDKRRVAVLISGRGSNMEALIHAAEADSYPGAIVLVIADNGEAPGLETARAAGIAALCVARSDYCTKREHEQAIHRALVGAQVEFICLAGFMRLLSAEFLAPWAGRILNIHPSLLPRYKGLDTHQRVLNAGDSTHGCTVHFVTAGMDEGPVIMQAQVTVEPGDNAKDLAGRVLVEEHRIYPEALRRVIEADTLER